MYFVNERNYSKGKNLWRLNSKYFVNEMDSEFTIPLTKDDLLCPSEGSYVVQEVYSVRGLPGKLSG